jgi:hypothetical protein
MIFVANDEFACGTDVMALPVSARLAAKRGELSLDVAMPRFARTLIRPGAPPSPGGRRAAAGCTHYRFW